MILALLLLANPPGTPQATSATTEHVEEFSVLFDMLGDGIFNSNSELWAFQRRKAQALGASALLSPRAPRTCKLDDGLVPLLGGVVAAGAVVDMQGGGPRTKMSKCPHIHIEITPLEILHNQIKK